MRRVLKPGGTLHSSSTVWPRTSGCVDGNIVSSLLQKRLFGGCHLTRPIVDLLTTAGFTITELDVFYEEGAPKFLAADSLGTAVSA